MHFERRNVFQNAKKSIFPRKKICVPNLPKIFRLVTRNTLIFLIWTELRIFLFFTVTKVKNDTGVAIKIPPDGDNSNIIRIEGEPSGVQRAKDELLKLANKIVSHQLIFCQ